MGGGPCLRVWCAGAAVTFTPSVVAVFGALCSLPHLAHSVNPLFLITLSSPHFVSS